MPQEIQNEGRSVAGPVAGDSSSHPVAAAKAQPEKHPTAVQSGNIASVGTNGVWSLFRDLVVSVVIAVIIVLFLYQPVHVEGTSMLPVLEDQDLLLINKFAYSGMGTLLGAEIHRGDVVVFRYPHDHSKSYIKRVIALPGDDLLIDHGMVYVNGAALRESYVPLKYEDDRSQPAMTVPKGEYFVMGDHRSISSDSRDFGPVERDLIYGKAAFVYWPVDQAGLIR
jgi:signal peptidase I